MDDNKKKQIQKSKFNWIFLIGTFLVAVAGSYLAQTYLSQIVGREEDGTVERLSNEVQVNGLEVSIENKQEDIIEQAMKSVVGISKLQANEESIFDVAVSQKWGLRDGSNCIRKWIYFNEPTSSWKSRSKINC